MSGSIYGGNEGIAADTYTGDMTIYDYGSIQAGSPNNNAMYLGSGNDTVYLYGLPNIVGVMNGGGGTNPELLVERRAAKGQRLAGHSGHQSGGL